jgi:lauroyl/myristoyl acyltransferase
MPNLFKILHLFGYAIYLGCAAVARLFPLPLVFLAGKYLGAAGYCVLRKRRRLAVANLRSALGKSETEARELALRHFMNLGANLLSALKIATMSDAQIRRRVTVEIAPEIPAAPDRKGWVAALSHMGNWELLGRLSPLFPQYRFGAIYQKLANDYVDGHFKKSRARSGVTLFDRRDGYWKSVAFLESGGVVGVLADQYAGTPGTWMPFFGRLTSTSTLASALAQRVGVDVLPVSINTTGLARWHVAVGHPLENSSDPETLTAAVNRELERQITASPADWLWSHNRWKTPRYGFLLSASNRRVYFPPGFDRAMLKPYRILVRSVDDPDEAALSVPAVRAIKRGRPDARVTVVASGALADFWKRVEEVDEVIAILPEETARTVVKKIAHAGEFEVGILLPETRRGAVEMFLAGVPCRLGAPRRFLLNHWGNPPGLRDPEPRGAERYRRIAESAGAVVL